MSDTPTKAPPTPYDVLRGVLREHVLVCYTGVVMCGGDGTDESDTTCIWEHRSTEGGEDALVRAWADHVTTQQVAALVAAGLATVTMGEPA